VAKLDIEWLMVLDEIHQTGSVTQAAERLGIAQATASIALAKLRRHFGDRLFTRTARGMEPTPFATGIIGDIRAALVHLHHARNRRDRFEATEAHRRFRLGMTDISEIVLMPRLINHVRTIAKGVRIEAVEISSTTARGLEDGSIDMAIGFMPQLDAGFHQRRLFAQNFACLAAAAHPRVRGRLTRRQFEAEEHIVVKTSGTGHAIVDKVLAREKVAREVVLELPSFLGVARVVARTELLVIVPRLLGETLAEQEAIQQLPTPVKMPDYDVKVHWHERFHDDPGNAWMRRTLGELFGERLLPERVPDIAPEGRGRSGPRAHGRARHREAT